MGSDEWVVRPAALGWTLAVAERVVVVGGDAAGMTRRPSCAGGDTDRERRRDRGAGADALGVLLRVRHPVLGRGGRRRSGRPRRADRRGAPARAASTCGCDTEVRRSTSRPGPCAVPATAADGTARVRHARAGDGRDAQAPGRARGSTRRRPRRPDPRRRPACARPARTARRPAGARRRRRRRLHRCRDGRGDGAPRAVGHRSSTGAPSRWARSTPTWAALVREAHDRAGHRRPSAAAS